MISFNSLLNFFSLNLQQLQHTIAGSLLAKSDYDLYKYFGFNYI